MCGVCVFVFAETGLLLARFRLKAWRLMYVVTMCVEKYYT